VSGSARDRLTCRLRGDAPRIVELARPGARRPKVDESSHAVEGERAGSGELRARGERVRGRADSPRWPGLQGVALPSGAGGGVRWPARRGPLRGLLWLAPRAAPLLPERGPGGPQLPGRPGRSPPRRQRGAGGDRARTRALRKRRALVVRAPADLVAGRSRPDHLPHPRRAGRGRRPGGPLLPLPEPIDFVRRSMAFPAPVACPHCGTPAASFRHLETGSLVCASCGRSFEVDEAGRP
jgi:hypothetical protein